MAEKTIKIDHELGLQARPAVDFAKLASGFPCGIQVTNVTTDSKFVNAKSLLEILSLGVNQGHEVTLKAEGEHAERALAALVEMIESNFGE